jgi:hypothetical protein
MRGCCVFRSWVRDAVIVRCSAMEFADHYKLAQEEQQNDAAEEGADDDDDQVVYMCSVAALSWLSGELMLWT